MRLNRREFLRLAALAAAGAVAGCQESPNQPTPNTPEPTSTPLPESEDHRNYRERIESALAEKNPELLAYLQEHQEHMEYLITALAHRTKLGLKSIPDTILNYKPKEATEQWSTEWGTFSGNLPPSMQSLNTIVKDYIQTAYSNQSFKTIREVKLGDGTSFHPSMDERFITFPLYYNASKLWTFMVVAHETAHGVDPELYNYPPELFFRMWKAKWLMCAQAWDVEGQFLNHPDDFLHKHLNYQVGKEAARSCRWDDDFDQKPGSQLIRSVIEEVKQKLGVVAETKDIVYTRRFVYEMGILLTKKIREGQLDTFLQELYESTLSWGMVETWAEMMKWGFLPPQIYDFEDGKKAAETTQQNPEIVYGVQETLSILQSKELDFAQEQEHIVQVFEHFQTLPSYEEQAPLVEKTEEELQEEHAWDLINDFLKGGTALQDEVLPKLSGKPLDLFTRYLVAYQDIIRDFPGASEFHHDPEAAFNVFDPKYLAAWNTDFIMEVMNRDTLKNLIKEILRGEDKTEQILQLEQDDRLEWIEWFAQSYHE